MAILPALVCVPVTTSHDTGASLAHAAADVAPAVAVHIAQGGRLDMGEASDGRLPVGIAVRVLHKPDLRAAAWQGLVRFAGLQPGFAGLVEELSGPGRAEEYLSLHGAAARARNRVRRLKSVSGTLASAVVTDARGFHGLHFFDTEETVVAGDLASYLRARQEEGSSVPFAFPVEMDVWTGVSEDDLMRELAADGRDRFDLDAVLRTGLSGFADGSRGRLSDESALWKIVGDWLEAGGPDARQDLVSALARWNAAQDIRSERVRRDVMVPLEEGVDRASALAWCGRKLAEAVEELRECSRAWTPVAALQGADDGRESE